MARPKGTKNTNTIKRRLDPLSPQERIEVLANLIVDKILDDQQNDTEFIGLEAANVDSV